MPVITLVAAPQQFRDEELLVPRERLQAAGYTVQTVSTIAGEGTGMLGHTERFTQTLADVDVDKTEGIVVVGGYGAVEHLWNNEALYHLLQQASAANKLVAAICVAPVVLAKAGLLQGKTASVWPMPESLAAFEQAGATVSEQAVTAEGKLVTANSPEVAEAFAEAVLKALQPVPVA
jgi:protease I